MTEMKILDIQALKEWEELTGTKIHGDHVRVPDRVYKDNAERINEIQISSAYRMKAKE